MEVNETFNNGSDVTHHIIEVRFAASLAVFVTLFTLVTLLFNFVLIMAVLRTTSLHTKTNALLVSVAGSDVILGLFVLPAIAGILYKQSLRFSETLCEFLAFMASLSSSSKSLGMLSVCVDRCVAISQPLQYSSCITNTTVLVLITCVWSISICFALLPLAKVGVYNFVLYHDRCMLDPELSSVYTLVKELTCTLLPSVAIAVTLAVIVAEARSHHRITAIAQIAITMYSGTGTMPAVKYARNTFRAMRTFLIITVIYLLTYFPRSLYVVISTATKFKSTPAFYSVSCLAFICSLSTPLVITTLNIKFRQSIRTMFKSHNKVSPLETETYTISTGLHSILEASMVMRYVTHNQNKDGGMIRKALKRNQSAEEVSSRYRSFPKHVIRSVHFQHHRIPVLNEIQSTSSGETITGSTKPAPAQMRPLRKMFSYPS